MKLGLRLQILILLGGSLLVVFVPLFFAVATYTRVTLDQVRQRHAQSLGQSIARHVLQAHELYSGSDLETLLSTSVASEAVSAIGVYEKDGTLIAQSGDSLLVGRLREALGNSTESLDGREHLAVELPGRRSTIIVAVRTDDYAGAAKPLLRLVALYTGLFALGLLVSVYFALTRLIVRPVTDLSAAAQRVAAGARRFSVPSAGARELVELGRSVRAMTDTLIQEEAALRRKVDEVEQATVKLRQTQGNLVRSERLASVGRLAAGLAHEIGNPVAALLGLIDLMLDGELERAETRDFLARMRRETERIHRIIGDLLQFSRSSAPAHDAPLKPGDLRSAIHDIATLVGPQKVMQGVALKLEVEPELVAVALGQEHLIQVLLNLVLNAADACQGRGRIIIRAQTSRNGVRLEVEDDGPGVPASVQQRLFEPFVTTKETGKGTGLGLAVCKGLVEASGGSIWLDTDYTAGARFVLDLPAQGA